MRSGAGRAAITTSISPSVRFDCDCSCRQAVGLRVQGERASLAGGTQDCLERPIKGLARRLTKAGGIDGIGVAYGD